MSTILLNRPTVTEVPTTSENVILRKLPAHVMQEVVSRGQLVRLVKDETALEAGAPIDAVYFPESAVFSLCRIFTNGQMVQIATIGREGAIGVESVLGVEKSSMSVPCHTNGVALRISAEDFKELFAKHIELQHACLGYAQNLINQLSISRACSLEHSIEQRSALWLLLTSLRCQRDHFFLTQDLLAEMLGISRTRVSIATSKFARHNLIKFSRGQMTILEWNKLEQYSCECIKSLSQMFSQSHHDCSEHHEPARDQIELEKLPVSA